MWFYKSFFLLALLKKYGTVTPKLKYILNLVFCVLLHPEKCTAVNCAWRYGPEYTWNKLLVNSCEHEKPWCCRDRSLCQTCGWSRPSGRSWSHPAGCVSEKPHLGFGSGWKLSLRFPQSGCSPSTAPIHQTGKEKSNQVFNISRVGEEMFWFGETWTITGIKCWALKRY